MDDNYVFCKTLSGADELSNRGSVLSPKHRRCLILVDGKKTLRELAAYFRPGELAPILRELVEHGFLERPPAGIAAIEASAARITLIDDARFAQVQQGAIRDLRARLGPAGEAVATQIGACARPEQLRIALRNIEKVLQGLMGPDEAKAFVKRVGQALIGG